MWLGRQRAIRPPGLFALYIARYCASRLLDELLRVDPAADVFGVRWNLLLAIVGTVVGLAWFAAIQRRTPEDAARRLPVMTGERRFPSRSHRVGSRD